MSISDRNYDTRLSFGTRMNPLVILIAISMIVFVVLAFFKAIMYVRYAEGTNIQAIFDKSFLPWFALPPALSAVAGKFWTVISHAFVHLTFWELFSNMLWLWCFGFIFIDLTGNRKLVPVFLYGTIAGAIGFLATAALFPAIHFAADSNYFFGCGAGILAICAAAVTISPNYKLLPMLGGGISLWIVGIIYLVIDMATIPPNYPAVHVAHLAGALAGFLFVVILRRGFDGSGWMNNLYDGFISLFNPESKAAQRRIIKNTSYYNNSNVPPFKKAHNITEKRLDEILDKINMAGGYDKLSEDEKDFLRKASREDFKK